MSTFVRPISASEKYFVALNELRPPFVIQLVLEGDGLVSVPWIPLQLTQSVIPIGAVLFILAQLLSLPDYVAQVRAGALGKKDADEPAQEKLE